MMEITLNDKKYDLHFGLRFLDEINKRFGVTMDVEGQTIQSNISGLHMAMTGLSQKSPSALAKVIQCATADARQKPSIKELETFIGKLIEDEKYDDFYDELLDELGKQPLVRKELGNAQ